MPKESSPPGDAVVLLGDMGMVTDTSLQHRRAGPGCRVKTTVLFSLSCRVSLGHWSLEKEGTGVA